MRYSLAVSAMIFGLAMAVGQASNPAALQLRPEDTARAQKQIERLGDKSYRVREEARRELAKMGRLAVRALEAGLRSDITEVRLACESLLPEAEAAELQARIQAFLADTKGEYDHELAGWKKFRFIAGDNPTTRDLYVKVLNNSRNFELLLAMKEIPEHQLPGLSSLAGGIAFTHPEVPARGRYARILNNRRYTFYQDHMQQMPNGGIRQITPPVHDHAFMLLAESLYDEKEAGWNQFSYQIMAWMYQPTIREAALGKSEFKESYRQIFLHWMETRDGVNSLSQMVNIVQNLNMGQVTLGRLAVKLLTLPNTQPWTKANALTILARNNCYEQFPIIRQTFGDTAVLVAAQPANNQPEILVQDVALAMALVMTKQDPKNYGYESQFPQESMRFNYTNFRFRDEEQKPAADKRAAALKQWQAWEATQQGGILGAAATIRPDPKK